MSSPYGVSAFLSGITWDFAGAVLHQALGSDLWAAAWCSNDSLMMAYGDGGGFNGDNTKARTRFGMHTVTGTPPSSFAFANTWGCKADGTGCDVGATHDPAADADFGGTIAQRGVPDGLTAVVNDLYAWVTNRDASPNDTILVKSTDAGHTWTEASWSFTHNTGDFAPTNFVQFADGQHGQPTNVDGYLYIPGGIVGDVTKVYLARVPKASIMTQADWQWFTTTDPNTPTWGTWANAQPIFTDGAAPGNGGPSGGGTMQYLPTLRRYIFIHLFGTVQNMHVFDAPNPWGPWTTVYYNDTWGSYGTSGGLFNTILPKFLTGGDKNFWMTFSGFSSPVNFDNLNIISGVFQLVPYGRWPLDENPAQHNTTIVDSSGLNNGTLVTNDGASNKSVAGRIATGIQLDGVDDYIDIANESNFDFNQQSFTVSVWVKDITGVGIIASKGGATDSGCWMFVISSTGLEFVIRDASGHDTVDRNASTSQPFNDGLYHHVAAVVFFDTTVGANNSVVLYVDGVAIATTDAGTGEVPVLNNKTLKWGARENNAGTKFTFLPGKLDDARIYNAALTANDIFSLAMVRLPFNPLPQLAPILAQ
jgi:Concanavalin A-like lectin/glucanases superfamily/Domain of unknown function (DUF4185)